MGIKPALDLLLFTHIPSRASGQCQVSAPNCGRVNTRQPSAGLWGRCLLTAQPGERGVSTQNKPETRENPKPALRARAPLSMNAAGGGSAPHSGRGHPLIPFPLSPRGRAGVQGTGLSGGTAGGQAQPAVRPRGAAAVPEPPERPPFFPPRRRRLRGAASTALPL